MYISMEALIFIGVFMGVFTRAIVPWMRKIHQGKINPPRFDKKYAYSAIAAMTWIFTMLVKAFYYLNPPENEYGAIFVLLISYISGWYGLDLQNEIGKLKSTYKKIMEFVEEAVAERPPQPQSQPQKPKQQAQK